MEELIINKADLTVMCIVAAAVAAGCKMGLIRSVIGVAANIAALIAARLAVPYLAMAARETPIYDAIKKYVAEELGIQGTVGAATQKLQTDIILNLPVPEFMKSALLENNNVEIHNMLDTQGVSDYISGYIANVILNALIAGIVMLLVWALMPMICRWIKAAADLPVIKTIDRALGGVLGFLQATILIWIICILIFLLNMGNENNAVMEEINKSYIAAGFYKSNILTGILMKII